MFRQSRNFVSAALGIAILVSTQIFLSPTPVRGCPLEPESLFSLYMGSEIVVLAEIRSERELEITDQYEGGYSVEVERKLDIIETFKGERLREMVYGSLEFRAKDSPGTNGEAANRIIYYGGYSRNVAYDLAAGKRYLFFFNKNSDTGQYELFYNQAVRKIGETSVDIYKDRFAELKAILNNKEHQAANFAEWLVRLIEEPETTWDGAHVLSGSFRLLEYENENSKEAESVQGDQDFSFYSSEIARSLSRSQKERISTVLYDSLANAAYENDDDGSDEATDYNLIRIVRTWEKSRVAIYAFNQLQAAGANESGRLTRFMRLVANVADDSVLYELAGQYANSLYEQDLAEIAVTEPDGPTENGAELQIAEPETEGTLVPELSGDAAGPGSSVAGPPVPPLEILSPQQTREKLLADFVDRFQILLAGNFEAAPRRVRMENIELEVN